MPFLSDLDHYRIDATLSDDGGRVLQYESVTDVALGLKDHNIQRTWLRKKTLSQGYYSEVWLEEQQDDTKSRRAVKTIQKSRMVEIQIDHMRELKALHEFSKAKHRQKGVFVDFLGWWEENDIVSFAMEYFPLGDLEANMKMVLKESAITQITRQLLQALDIMHGMKFAHRDLKPANIFVVRRDPSWWVKIGDFGMSKQIEGGDAALHTYVGTYNYMAPEFFGYVGNANEEKFEYTCAIDLWALGCIVYRLCTQTVPFPFDNSSVPLKNYCERPTLFPVDALISRSISNELVALVRSLLRSEPSKRLPAGAGLALIQTFADEIPELKPSSSRLPESMRSDVGVCGDPETDFTNMAPSSSGIVVSKSADQSSSPQRILSKVESGIGIEEHSCSLSGMTGLQQDHPGAPSSPPERSSSASIVRPSHTMTRHQYNDDERYPPSPQSQQREGEWEHPSGIHHKPSRSGSDGPIQGSAAAPQLEFQSSHNPSASRISAKPDLGGRAISAPDRNSTKKSFLGKIRRTISGGSASAHSVYGNPFAGAYAPLPTGHLQKLEEANVVGRASDLTQRKETNQVKPAKRHKMVKRPLASPSDTLVDKGEDSLLLTEKGECETNDLLGLSRRFSGQSSRISLSSWDTAKCRIGPGINIKTTELNDPEDQAEEILAGVQWDTRTLADYCDQVFNPVA